MKFAIDSLIMRVRYDVEDENGCTANSSRDKRGSDSTVRQMTLSLSGAASQSSVSLILECEWSWSHECSDHLIRDFGSHLLMQCYNWL